MHSHKQVIITQKGQCHEMFDPPQKRPQKKKRPFRRVPPIEKGFIQKARQTVVVSVWGARSYAAYWEFLV